MSVNMSPQISKQPLFVKEIKGAGADHGIQQGYANINDIANLRQISADHWEANSISHAKNPDGPETTYHFDNQSAQQILNYMA